MELQGIQEFAKRATVTDRGMTVEEVAALCYHVNRAYCQSMGDDSFSHWNEAPDWQKESNINGVMAHLKFGLTPEQSHESWMKQKLTEGWKYGPVKDPEKKEHPCMVPYDQLPPEQKAKDFIFKAIVDFFKHF